MCLKRKRPETPRAGWARPCGGEGGGPGGGDAGSGGQAAGCALWGGGGLMPARVWRGVEFEANRELFQWNFGNVCHVI